MTVHTENVEISRLKELGEGNWQLQGMTDVTVLFGKNSSGKSLLLRAWREKDKDFTHYVTPERIGEMKLDPNQIITQQSAGGRMQRSQGNFAPDYRQQVITRIYNYFMRRGNYRNEMPPCNPSDLEKHLNILLPDFTVSLQGDAARPFRLYRGEKNSVGSADNEVSSVEKLSSGEAQILTVALDILTIAAIWKLDNIDKRILLIDEPDAHIHPDLQVRFADFILRVMENFNTQVVIATHSTTLLSALGQLGKGKTSVIYIDRLESSFKAKLFDKVLIDLATCLGGHVLMGPLSGAPILLVEGDDDYRIWSQVPRHHKINLSVIPCSGSDEMKKYQKILEEIFHSLSDSKEPVGFALLDGDKELPQVNKDNPQTFVKFIKLNCREVENLFLTDEVISDLGVTWDDAKRNIKVQSKEHGKKASKLAKVSEWDKQNEDIKDVINEVSMILDEKNVHWTIRIGRRIGKERPQGELAQFLGKQVVLSLWGEESKE